MEAAAPAEVAAPNSVTAQENVTTDDPDEKVIEEAATETAVEEEEEAPSDFEEEEAPVLKKNTKRAKTAGAQPQRVRTNIHIPPTYVGMWLATEGRNGTKPVVRSSDKYCYGIGGALALAGLSVVDWRRLFTWIKLNVTTQSWMGQLRRGGLGDGTKSSEKLNKRNHRLANTFRKWCRTHNEHNKGETMTCNTVTVIEIAGRRVTGEG